MFIESCYVCALPYSFIPACVAVVTTVHVQWYITEHSTAALVVPVSGHSPPLSTLPLPASLCHSLPLPLPSRHPPLPSNSSPFPTLPLPLPSLANPSTLSVIASVLLLTLYVHVCVCMCVQHVLHSGTMWLYTVHTVPVMVHTVHCS